MVGDKMHQNLKQKKSRLEPCCLLRTGTE